MTNKEQIERISKLLNELNLDDITSAEFDEMFPKQSINDIKEELWLMYCFAEDVCVTINMGDTAEQEPQADYKTFAKWVANEIFSDEWELNKDAFAEVACRKLAKLGIVEESGNNWVLNESDEDDMTIQFKISKYLYKCLKKRIELNVASELDRLVDKGTVIEQAPSCSPNPIITIDGIRYIAEEPKLKTVHKDGEVVIGGFREIV